MSNNNQETKTIFYDKKCILCHQYIKSLNLNKGVILKDSNELKEVNNLLYKKINKKGILLKEKGKHTYGANAIKKIHNFNRYKYKTTKLLTKLLFNTNLIYILYPIIRYIRLILTYIK